MVLQPRLGGSPSGAKERNRRTKGGSRCRMGLDAWTRDFLDSRRLDSAFLSVSRPRMIIIEGTPGSDRIALAQAIGLQFEAHGLEARCPAATEKGHPLRRIWDEGSYHDVSSFAQTLIHQWQNFAISMRFSRTCVVSGAMPWLRGLLPAALHIPKSVLPF